MKINDGGWPVLFGTNPLANGALRLAIDEDQITDAERSHGSEQVAYLVLGGASDLGAPIVTAPADITAEATGLLSSPAIGQATSSDGSPVTNNAPSAGFPLGTTVVTWSATNLAGLTGTAQQQVTLVDTTGPQITAPANVVAQGTGVLTAVALGQATATDLFGPVSIANNAPSGGFPIGTTVVTWTATDANGNRSSATQSVTVVDGGGGANQAPTAANDTATVAQGGTVTINVLSNDSDPDGSLNPASLTTKSSPLYGTLANNGAGVLTYTHNGSATTSDSFTYSVKDDQGAESNIATVSISVDSQPAIVSDNFNQGTLDTGVWTFVNPLGDATLALNGAQAVIAVPGGTAHDIWTAGNFAPRLMQSAPDRDFEVEVKFDSPVTQRFQIQGLVVEESPGRFVRFDVHHDGTRVRVFVATLVDGVASARHNVATTLSGSPLYLRLARQGNLWTPKYSTDGATWQTLAAFSHVMIVSAIGIFAGNSASAGGAVPAHTTLVDRFINTAAPSIP
jgi:hypothetical protein